MRADEELNRLIALANPKTKVEGATVARMQAEVAKDLPLFEEEYPMADAALFAKMIEKRRVIRFVLKALAEDGLQRRRTMVKLLTYMTLGYRKDWKNVEVTLI